MKIQHEVPALTEAAQALNLIQSHGVTGKGEHVVFVAPPLVRALELIGAGLVLVAFAIVLSGNGSKVAGKGGRHGR